MGQYHQLTCPDLNACVTPHAMGSGAKAWEQINTVMIHAAFGLLCAAGFGQHPRSLPWLNKGQWAGRHIAMIGDYCEPTDLLNHPTIGGAHPDEPDLYTCTRTGKPSTRRKAHMTCVAHALVPAIERITSTRAVGYVARPTPRDSLHFVGPITKQGDTWDFDGAGYTPKERTSQQDYLDRISPNRDYARAPIPLAKAPDSIPGITEAGTGEAALWVSIDAGEFVDPAAFGAPDLAAILDSTDASYFVLSTLFHPEARGGGDLPPCGALGVVGRWRGDRLVLLGPGGLRTDGRVLTQEEVRAQFRDVTPLAQAWTTHMDSLRAHEEPTPGPLGTSPLTAAQRTRLGQIVRGLQQAKVITEQKQIQVITRPAATCTHGETAYAIPPSISLYCDDGLIWLPRTEREAMVRDLATGRPLILAPCGDDRNNDRLALTGGDSHITTIPIGSAHQLMAAMAA